jgi:GGDEF domain-containing protein
MVDLDRIEKSELYPIIRDNPVGMALLDNQRRVFFLNDKLKDYFEGDFDLSKKFFGNVFHCSNICEDSKDCGTTNRCKFCDLKNSSIIALKSKKTVSSIKFHNSFILNGRLVEKWFDISLVNVQIENEDFLLASFVDLNEILDYDFEERLIRKYHDEFNYVDKNDFNEEVIKIFESDLKSIKHDFIVFDFRRCLITNSHIENLWIEDVLNELFSLFKITQSNKDFIARYSEDRFLLFYNNKLESEIEYILSQISKINDKPEYSDMPIQFVNVKVNIDLSEYNSTDSQEEIYLIYFKIINKIMKIVDKNQNKLVIKTLDQKGVNCNEESNDC